MLIKKVLIVIGSVLILVLAGCAIKSKGVAPNENIITVGVSAGPEEQLAIVAAKVALEKYGLEVKLVTFPDYITPNVALAKGTIDANVFQHKPFLDQQIAARGYKFAIAGYTFVYPLAAYSSKIQSIEELKNGDKIAVPSDSTNLARALLLLEKQGVLTLKEGSAHRATIHDIVKLRKQLKIIKVEASKLPSVFDDVQIAIINANYAREINLVPEKDGLFVEEDATAYINLIVARNDNVNTEKVKNFVKAYQSNEVYQAAMKAFKGGVIKGW